MANDNQIQQQATLGCGSLILIALIVIIFSKSGADELHKEIKSLGGEVKMLKQSVESQSTQIKELRASLEKAKAQ
jgi:Sec-independent protein translocase protein TatA